MSAKPAASPETDAPKKSKKMLFIIVGAVVALAGAGGGYFYYASAKKAALAAAEDESPVSKKTPAKAPIFLPLDSFTVNLADTHAEKMAQIAVSLKLVDQKTADEIKIYMPAIRHNILKVIAAKESRLLLTNEGKDQLAHEIAIVSAEPLGWEPPEGEGLPSKQDKDSGAEKSNKSAEVDKDAKEAKGDKSKAKKAKKKAPPPNPVEQVHFSQFIVQ